MPYKLIWSDEFSNSNLDLSKWTVEEAGHGFGNNEDQYYTSRARNIFIKEGQLKIEAHKEMYEHRSYTSAKITTYGKFSFKYGRVVVRAKIPQGKGTWPAIWMLPNSIRDGVKWPSCGEIDIMEHVGRDEDMIHFSLHTGKYNHAHKTQFTYFERMKGISNRFADYEMIWDENSIEFKVDGLSYAKFVKGQENKDTDFEGWPFDDEFYLILNLAIGGYWGGKIDDAALPATLYVESVKVYQNI